MRRQLRRFARQNNVKSRTIRTSRGPKPTIMGFDNRATNRQPHSHSPAFRRNERVEDTLDIFRIDTSSGVLHRDHYTGFTRFGFHSQHSWSISHGIHCFGCIHDQVENDLLQLNTIAGYLRDGGKKFGVNRNLVTVQLISQEHHDFTNEVIDVEWGPSRIILLIHRPDASNQLTRTMTVFDNAL